MRQRWISIKVHPNAGKDVLLGLGADRFEVWVRARPVNGRANDAVITLLAQGLQIPRERFRLVKGGSGRHKVFSILG